MPSPNAASSIWNASSSVRPLPHVARALPIPPMVPPPTITWPTWIPERPNGTRRTREEGRSAEGGVEGDRGAGERLAHRAVGLRPFGGLLEGLGREAGDGAPDGDVDPGDAFTGLEGDLGAGREPLRRMSTLSQRM